MLFAVCMLYVARCSLCVVRWLRFVVLFVACRLSVACCLESFVVCCSLLVTVVA